MDQLNPAQLGIAGFVVALLMTGITVLWGKYQKALADKDAMTAAVLPALTQASAAVSASVVAIDRVTVLYEHRMLGPPDAGR